MFVRHTDVIDTAARAMIQSLNGPDKRPRINATITDAGKVVIMERVIKHRIAVDDTTIDLVLANGGLVRFEATCGGVSCELLDLSTTVITMDNYDYCPLPFAELEEMCLMYGNAKTAAESVAKGVGELEVVDLINTTVLSGLCLTLDMLAIQAEDEEMGKAWESHGDERLLNN